MNKKLFLVSSNICSFKNLQFISVDLIRGRECQFESEVTTHGWVRIGER